MFTAHDYFSYPNAPELLDAWWQDRKTGEFPFVLLPPVATIVEWDGEPMAFLALYMTIGHGMAFLEWPVTKPKGGLRAAMALKCAMDHLKRIAKVHNYGILRVSTLPKIARALQREGWTLEDTEPRIPLMIQP